MSEPAGSFGRGIIFGAFFVIAVAAAVVIVAGFLR